jgi:AcrR family transcriptional regulator
LEFALTADPLAETREKPTAASPKRPRADAQRNRERLAEVAALEFAEHGIETSLEEIARKAGVGIGTLYRHFPSREHLVEVVYRREVEALSGAADELAARHPPDVALSEWMQRFVDYIAAKRGMANSLKLLSASNSELFSSSWGMISQALRRLLDAARAEGLIREDIDVSDVFHALSGIYAAPASPDWRDRSRRLVSLLMDGLRAGARRGQP